MRPSSGFTLYEILIVMGITLTLVGLTAALSNQALRNGEFDRVRETIRGELAHAQADTISGTLDANWGVAFASNSVTRYQGSSYATRNATYDRFTSFQNGVTISGTADVAFTRPKGLPLSAATVVVTDGIHTSTTTVNAAGGIDVQ